MYGDDCPDPIRSFEELATRYDAPKWLMKVNFVKTPEKNQKTTLYFNDVESACRKIRAADAHSSAVDSSVAGQPRPAGVL